MDITLKDVSVTYMKNTPFEKIALQEVNLTIKSGSIIGVIGHTGSGKSTLIQLISGLILPTNGTIKVGDLAWSSKRKNLSLIRNKIGVVFQYPEHQLFEESVEKDISFALRNFDFPEELIAIRVKEAMKQVGLDYEQFAKRSPFELSGGQMRRVAIAGVIAFQPKILILDEPTAGLDPKGRKEILNMIKELHQSREMTTILVSHSMDDIANMVERLIVLNQGKIILEGTPKEIFKEEERLQQIGLDIPDITKFIQRLNQKINPPIPLDCFSREELEEYLIDWLLKGKKV
ncbi:energy-coupling factor transporter ATPase [Tepidibacillus decaturensis]|uniref:Energy-coupling factor transporter ATP-binding protein EcfA2 n=1 Tax=Tepidibacillus decaturensis TaxID=1413211 RepID=A0A135L7H7_9BACI|nr:energy-coupling factor transporter ATPase [Tepidibacillus decaturensis]KXG44930.1 energy-coupling factor transporter ATPase [Tepidibacillus decaturensis]